VSLKNSPEVQKPRRAKLKTVLAYQANAQKADGTLRKYRTGYFFAHSIKKAGEVLLKAGFKGPGNYYPKNQHLGRMFALPREVPKQNKFGEEEAGWVLQHCLQAHATKSQADGVKKMLSYAWQLQRGKKGNFPMVQEVWDQWDPDEFGEPTQTTKANPEFVIKPENLKVAMTSEWTQRLGMLLPHWSSGYLLVYHWCLNGARSKEDLCKRIKNGVTKMFPSEGAMYTTFRGGRAKMEGWGFRAWKAWAVCMCPGGKHAGPPPDWWNRIIEGQEPEWCTTCPLSAYKVLQDSMEPDDPRIFPCHTKMGFTKATSMGPDTMFPFLQKWLTLQGGNPDNVVYHTNMGRKALGRLCDAVKIPYPKSFQSHGDKFQNWKCYQKAPVNDLNFTEREQSTEIPVVTASLRMIARWFGRGPTVREDPADPSLRQVMQMVAALGRERGMGTAMNRIMDGNQKTDWED